MDKVNFFRAGRRLISMAELDDASLELLARGMLVDRVLAVLPNLGAFKRSGPSLKLELHGTNPRCCVGMVR